MHPGRPKLKRYKKMTLARRLKRPENRAVFVIMYEGLPVSQVIALVASQSLDRVWTIVGTSALETAERNEPTFQAVIASFEIITNPSPAYISPVGSPPPRRSRGLGRPPRGLGPLPTSP